MRLPDITLAILLTSCSPETRHCGRALLETICQELNFQAPGDLSCLNRSLEFQLEFWMAQPSSDPHEVLGGHGKIHS